MLIVAKYSCLMAFSRINKIFPYDFIDFLKLQILVLTISTTVSKLLNLPFLLLVIRSMCTKFDGPSWNGSVCILFTMFNNNV